MDTQFVRDVQSYQLSPARRIFVMQEILSAIADTDHGELRERIERIIDMDRANVARDTSSRSFRRQGLDPNDSKTGPGSGPDRRRRAHREFVALVVYILSSYSTTTARQLLTPVSRQLDRLHRFESRPQTECQNRFGRQPSSRVSPPRT